MDAFERELKECFLEEAAGLLSETESTVLQLEKSPGDASLREKILRLAHNLKGSARAVGFPAIGDLTHHLESVLHAVGRGEKRPGPEMVEVLLLAHDELRSMVAGLRRDLAFQPDWRATQAALDSFLSGESKTGPKPVSNLQKAVNDYFPPASSFPEIPVEAPTPVAAPPPASALRDEAPAPKAQEVAKAAEENVRVAVGKLERLLNHVGELVILEEILTQHADQIESPMLRKTVSHLSKITKEIQSISMGLRLTPCRSLFQKIERVVRDTAKSLGKPVLFETDGEETELDRAILEALGDPLVHLVRNALDHGLESPGDRGGKAPMGKISLRAFRRGWHIVVEVQDDGRGIDVTSIRRKAIERGLASADDTLTDEEALQFIYAPGFSTRSTVDAISGRGVGMDVVKTTVEQLRGEVLLTTSLGVGTRFQILLPLTVSITDGMVVLAGTERFVVPTAHVHETLQPKASDLKHVSGMGEILTLRGESLPLYRLDRVLGRQASVRSTWESIAIVVRSGKQPFSVLVDDIVGHQQVVIKPLGNEWRQLKGITGGAILGDGKPALILDFAELVQKKSSHPTSRETECQA